MMVATKSERIFRIRWDGVEERDFSLDLKRIPFSINQQVSYGKYYSQTYTIVTYKNQAQKERQTIIKYCFYCYFFSCSDIREQYICIVNGVFAVDRWLCNYTKRWTSGIFNSKFTKI